MIPKDEKKRWITDWWPERLNLSPLKQNRDYNNPLGKDFDYPFAFESLDLSQVKNDLKEIMKTSQDWWPADFGHYGPLFIRLAWHSAGSYRIFDGRGGARRGEIRFPPRINWPDNINLDKAIRLLWPIKQKYGKKLSWADLIILAGTVALEDMGVKILGFGGGREDIWEPDEGADWGQEIEMLSGKNRFTEEGKLREPYAATEMGLIYVNPAGPEGIPIPEESAKQIRTAFRRMGMTDEETVALIAGGHAFGKCHGAAEERYLGKDPSNSDVEMAGLGWKFDYKTGKGKDTYTSGFELTWSNTPTKFGISYLEFLFKYDWEITKSPAGKPQWIAKNAPEIIPDAHDPSTKHKPMMLTTDLALIYDPVYSEIAKKFMSNPKIFEESFARAWFKLTHRDMGPIECYLGPDVPKETFIWQDPLPRREYELVNGEDIRFLKTAISKTNISKKDFLYTAISATLTYRDSDRRGGINGSRIRLEPIKNYEVNHPERLKDVIESLESIKFEFEKNFSPKGISIADLIVLAGNVALEKSVPNIIPSIDIAFIPGRRDALQDQVESDFYKALEPTVCPFRNYIKYPNLNRETKIENSLVDRAQQLKLSVQELVCLYGGLRSLGLVYNFTDHGVLTLNSDNLSTDFFINLYDSNIEWHPTDEWKVHFEGINRKHGNKKWRVSRLDLTFAHHDELRTVGEIYASKDGTEKFIHDFISVWTKLMHIDRFDIWREDRKLYKDLTKGIC